MIELHWVGSNQAFAINPKHIISICSIEFGSRIEMSNKTCFHVTLPYEELFALINDHLVMS